MSQARDIHGVVQLLRDGIALAGDQRGRNRAFVAWNHGTDPFVDGVAHSIDRRGVAQAQSLLGGRFDGLDLSKYKT